jgi:hypothetical protein
MIFHQVIKNLLAQGGFLLRCNDFLTALKMQVLSSVSEFTESLSLPHF